MPGTQERSGPLRRPAVATGLLIAFAVVTAAAWVVAIRSADHLALLLGGELSGATPTDHASYFALVTVMMAAMMLPSAVPMVAVYRGLARLDSTRPEGDLRAGLFSASYVLAWGAFAGSILIAVSALGLMGGLVGPTALVPGLVLVAAGAYQFSSWKRYCLERCQTPLGYLMGHWRPGRGGSLRLGISYAAYCLGCCWLLMIVVFVTGAMSLLWMVAFSGLVLVEKVGSGGAWFTRSMGVGATAVGIWLAATVALGS